MTLDLYIWFCCLAPCLTNPMFTVDADSLTQYHRNLTSRSSAAGTNNARALLFIHSRSRFTSTRRDREPNVYVREQIRGTVPLLAQKSLYGLPRIQSLRLYRLCNRRVSKSLVEGFIVDHSVHPDVVHGCHVSGPRLRVMYRANCVLVFPIFVLV